MANPTIRFSHRYRKHEARVFTTIRSWRNHKEEYYRREVGQVFNVELQKLVGRHPETNAPEYQAESMGRARLLAVYKDRVQDLDPHFKQYDTLKADRSGHYRLRPGPCLVLFFIWEK
jgi:hypothetical protein